MDLIEVTGILLTRSPNKRPVAAGLGAIVLRRRGAVRVDVTRPLGGHARVAVARRARRPRPAFPPAPAPWDETPRTRSSTPPARRRSSPRAARARSISSSTRIAAPSPMFMPDTIAVERPAGLGIHQPQRVEAAEGQARDRVGSTRERGVEPAEANRVRRLADGDRARRARRDHARAKPAETVARRDDVDRRAGEVVPRLDGRAYRMPRKSVVC